MSAAVRMPSLTGSASKSVGAGTPRAGPGFEKKTLSGLVKAWIAFVYGTDASSVCHMSTWAPQSHGYASSSPALLPIGRNACANASPIGDQASQRSWVAARRRPSRPKPVSAIRKSEPSRIASPGSRCSSVFGRST